MNSMMDCKKKKEQVLNALKPIADAFAEIGISIDYDINSYDEYLIVKDEEIGVFKRCCNSNNMLRTKKELIDYLHARLHLKPLNASWKVVCYND